MHAARGQNVCGLRQEDAYKLIELRNQADSLLLSYKSTLKENDYLISDDIKAEASQKMAALQAALADPALTVKAVKQNLENFQQTLFAMGADVYKRAKPDRRNDAASSDSAPSERA